MKKVLIGLLIIGLLGVGGYYWNQQTIQRMATVETDQADGETESQGQPAKKTIGRVNMLVLGTDNRGAEVARADTIMLVTANVDNHQVSVISIPRDTRVDVAGVGLTKINHANAVGELRGGVREGSMATAAAVSKFLDLPVNYYVKIDFQGFKKAVDALGGIDITLDEPISGKGLQLAAGTHHLTGAQALQLSRVRHGLANGDFDRQRHQFYLLSALGRQMVSRENITKLPESLKIVSRDLVDTNMSVAEMSAMGLEFKDITLDDVRYYQIPGKGITAPDPLVGSNLYFYEPDMAGVKEVVQKAMD